MKMSDQNSLQQDQRNKSVIHAKMEQNFPFLHIYDIHIRENTYDDTTFFVDVIVQDGLDKKHAFELAGAVPLIRPELINTGEDRFPVFSFIAHSEAGTRRYA